MTLPTSEPLSSSGFGLPPARRRRSRRNILPGEEDERAAFLKNLARTVTPSIDFFLFTFLSAVVLGAGIMFDAPALYVLAALMAPFMAPFIGIGLATVVGSVNFFLQEMGSLLVGSLITFACGAAFGLLSKFLPVSGITQAAYHVTLSWPNFLLLSLGAVLTTYLLLRSPTQRPLVASVAVAYEIYLPIGVAGFGLTGNVLGLFPDGLVVFLVHLGWTALVITVTMMVMGMRPATLFGYGLTTTIVLACVFALIAISGFGTAMGTNVALPTPLPSQTPTVTETPTITLTPLPPTSTLTPTMTLIPTETPTLTFTPEPTLVQAIVRAPEEYGGAVVRATPSFDAKVVVSISNGTIVYVFPDTYAANDITWVHVRLSDKREGWLVRDLIVTATPQPTW